MVLKIKKGGIWNTVLDGKFFVKSGGAWRSPSMIYIKSDGAWRDSGYRGAPKPPSGLAINAWDYDSAQAKWTAAAAGGPAISYYRIELRNEANTSTIAGENSTDVTGPSWTVAKDTKYQFRVQSVGTNALTSAWIYLKIKIGHPAVNNYGNVNHTGAYTSAAVSGSRNRDAPFWVTVSTGSHGGNILIQGLHWRDLRTPQSSVVTPGTDRLVYFVVFSNDYGTLNAALGTVNSGDNTDHALNNWSDDVPGEGWGQRWGIIARGTGWSNTSNSTYMLHCDSLWITGTEYWTAYEVTSTTPAVGNTYW